MKREYDECRQPEAFSALLENAEMEGKCSGHIINKDKCDVQSEHRNSKERGK